MPEYYEHYNKPENYKKVLCSSFWGKDDNKLEQMIYDCVKYAKNHHPNLVEDVTLFFRHLEEKKRSLDPSARCPIRTWFLENFGKMRSLMGHGTIRPTRRTGPIGSKTKFDPETKKLQHEKNLLRNPTKAATVAQNAKIYQARSKQERKAQRDHHVRNHLASINDTEKTGFETAEDLLHYLLHKKRIFAKPNVANGTDKLPFGRATLGEALAYAFAHKEHFHCNVCTTTRSDEEEEWRRYTTTSTQASNSIFSLTDVQSKCLPKEYVIDPKQSDFCVTELYSYVGNSKNGRDNLMLKVESDIQGIMQKKLPVGTLGFRFDKAGRPVGNKSWPENEERVCKVYFVYSESKILKLVEKGQVMINPTRSDRAIYNTDIWSSTTWKPVHLVIPKLNKDASLGMNTSFVAEAEESAKDEESVGSDHGKKPAYAPPDFDPPSMPRATRSNTNCTVRTTTTSSPTADGNSGTPASHSTIALQRVDNGKHKREIALSGDTIATKKRKQSIKPMGNDIRKYYTKKV